MATIESMAIRCNAALVRLEDAIQRLDGKEPFKQGEKRPIRRVYRDREMLRVIQLETLADLLEKIELKPTVSVAKTRPVRKPKKATVKRKAVVNGNANGI